MAAAPLTVVMITRDRRDSALHAVRTLRALPEQPPVIVVDNGSSDGTADTLSALAGVQVIRPGRNLGSAGRTLGVEAARSPYVAFSDDDSWWAPGALARAAQLFERHDRLGLLAAQTSVGPLQRPDPLNAVLAAAPVGREADLPGPSVLGFLACSAVVRRSAYLQVGGFHPRLGIGGEEELLALDLAAAGWGLAFVADVLAHHHPDAGQPRIDRAARQRRNELWTTWLRRPASEALMHTARCAWAALDDPVARQALRQSTAGFPWVLRERRPLPRPIVQRVRQLEQAAARPGRSVNAATPVRAET